MNFKDKINIWAKLSLILILGLFITLSSCNKKNDYSWYSYDETNCLDAWTFSSNNETLKDNVVSYFKTRDITVYDIEIFVSKDAEPLKDCASKTGRVIKCKVKNRDASSIKNAGFYE
jgi:hypothetical protein